MRARVALQTNLPAFEIPEMPALSRPRNSTTPTRGTTDHGTSSLKAVQPREGFPPTRTGAGVIISATILLRQVGMPTLRGHHAGRKYVREAFLFALCVCVCVCVLDYVTNGFWLTGVVCTDNTCCLNALFPKDNTRFALLSSLLALVTDS